jgi:AraC-like DNA-binding protein
VQKPIKQKLPQDRKTPNPLIMIKDQYSKAYLYMRIVQAKLFIDKYFAGAINLNDITSEAFFSKYHFIRAFKNIYGLTPHQYLQKFVLKKPGNFSKDDWGKLNYNHTDHHLRQFGV